MFQKFGEHPPPILIEGWSQMRIGIHSVLGLFFCIALLTLLETSAARAQVPTPPQTTHKDLGQMSIEELMNLEVTSGAKKVEPMQRTAAAIFVITGEDIRRSGATTLPDVLRMVPGLDVAQIDGSSWAVSSRGFNSEFSNKMLVLVDGRTIYSPVFSGVFWDTQDQMLADIDRIEVIRGPGAALWGTNAVNGVINIITKTAEHTQGGLLTVAGGNVEGGYGSAQYGGKLGNLGFFRVFAKGFAKISVPGNLSGTQQNGWSLEHGGFRTDWTISKRNSLTVQGDLFHSTAQGTSGFTTSLNPLVFSPLASERRGVGGNILGRWHHTISSSSETNLQVYFDRNNLDTPSIRGDVDTVDVDFQHEFALGKRNSIVWGINYRYIRINTEGTTSLSFTPARVVENLWSGFLQDEIELIPSRLRLTMGIRFQQDYSTGIELQPDVRLIWTPTGHHAIWLAASKALRGMTPTDTSLHALLGAIPAGAGLLLVPEVSGDLATKPEVELSGQAGYRTEITSNLSVDLALFYNSYTRLRGQDAGAPIFEFSSFPPFILQPEVFNSKIHGETHGLELSSTWKPFPRWKLSGSYSWLDGAFRDNSTGAPPGTTATVLQSPRHQFSIRSNLNLPRRFEFDVSLYRIGKVDPLVADPYNRLDVRIGWRWGEHADFSFVGQNLLSPGHTEFSSASNWILAASIRRSYYGKCTWHF
jgi:iron complex outermembrane receptor protein